MSVRQKLKVNMDRSDWTLHVKNSVRRVLLAYLACLRRKKTSELCVLRALADCKGFAYTQILNVEFKWDWVKGEEGGEGDVQDCTSSSYQIQILIAIGWTLLLTLLCARNWTTKWIYCVESDYQHKSPPIIVVIFGAGCSNKFARGGKTDSFLLYSLIWMWSEMEIG